MADPNNSGTMNEQGTNERLRSEANQAGDNQTLRAEQAKAEVSRQDQPEKAQTDEQRGEKSAIGGGQQPTGQSHSQTGEPGRARDELSQNRSEPVGH
jgi:hypothetical protein